MLSAICNCGLVERQNYGSYVVRTHKNLEEREGLVWPISFRLFPSLPSFEFLPYLFSAFLLFSANITPVRTSGLLFPKIILVALITRSLAANNHALLRPCAAHRHEPSTFFIFFFTLSHTSANSPCDQRPSRITRSLAAKSPRTVATMRCDTDTRRPGTIRRVSRTNCVGACTRW